MRAVELITSREFSRNELITSLLQMGVQRSESEHSISAYYIERGEAIIWIDLDNPEYPDLEIDVLIENVLGASPNTRIILHIMSIPGSELLALELAIRFATRWPPCVLNNNSGLAHHVFTLAELQDLAAHGQDFWEVERGVPMPKEWYTVDEEYLAQWEKERREQQSADAAPEKQENQP